MASNSCLRGSEPFTSWPPGRTELGSTVSEGLCLLSEAHSSTIPGLGQLAALLGSLHMVSPPLAGQPGLLFVKGSFQKGEQSVKAFGGFGSEPLLAPPTTGPVRFQGPTTSALPTGGAEKPHCRSRALCANCLPRPRPGTDTLAPPLFTQGLSGSSPKRRTLMLTPTDVCFLCVAFVLGKNIRFHLQNVNSVLLV